VRYRIEVLSERVRAAEVVAALDERRAEGATDPVGPDAEPS